MLEIAKSVSSLEAGLYREGALRILKSLYENYGAWDRDEEGILTKGTMSYHQEKGRNRPLIYGDFFFLEALAKLRGESRTFW
jgi:unsaturated chondroitin disaccharide hydrolase